jgi:hypothetical protein
MSGENPRRREHLPPQPPEHRERGAVVALAATGLAIGLLAAMPTSSATSRAAFGRGHHHRGTRPATTPTTTTLPAGGSASTTTTTSAAVLHVAVLAPSSASATAATKAKLRAAHVVLVPEAPIPSSWVSTLAGPQVQYPPGLSSEAAQVARILGVPASTVVAEAPGTSHGAGVIEVFLPPG